MKMNMKLLFLTFAILYSFITASMAAVPDLTAGGVPNEDPPHTFNMGPTGARGWAYHETYFTTDSRQILVTNVYSGSPAYGILAVNDVILGADGTGASPSNFSSDARKSFALAIADAEARTPATLKLIRWRAGVTSTVTLTLRTMGAYSATAPYNCPKSTKILQEGLQYVYDHESAGSYSFGGITLLATGNPTYLAKAQTIARGLIPSKSKMTKMMSDERDATSMIAWERGLVLIFLSEYYLATVDAGTPDSTVIPAIEAYAVNIAKNTSLFGTTGHGFGYRNDDGSANGPLKDGYGAVNTPGLMCLLGISLAKECGLDNPEIDPAIERASRFFAYYFGKGTIPYGEHEPGPRTHESNGKCGLGALVFNLQDDRVEEGKFFSKMSTASTNTRERGHTGSYFNFLWAPLGAAVGGEEAASAHFRRISWMLDLNRCWDGKIQYDCLNGEGPRNGSNYNGFQMSTAVLLNYALPLRKLYITGKGHDPSRWLSSDDVAEAIAADDYIPDNRSNSELIADISSWSAMVRKNAADELGTRSISASELNQVTALAKNKNGSSHSRAGACYALGQIGNSSSAAVLAPLLTDSDNFVRYMAAEGMRYLPSASNLPYLNTILTATVSTANPLYPMVEEDPMHLAHGRLAALLFSSSSPKGIISDSVAGVDRNLLYPAIRAVAENPIGTARGTLEKTYSNLTYHDVLELSGTIVDSIIYPAPADVMFRHQVRAGGVAALYQFGIAEGVPAGMIFCGDTTWNGGNRIQAYERLGAYGGSVYTVTPDPGTVPFLESYVNDSEVGETVQTILDAIAADTNPRVLMPLKSIQSVTADDRTVTLPASSTTLHVSGNDYAKGESVYTWRKFTGPGEVTFTPNGTAAAADTTIVFDDAAGSYEFEVTMSDSRGLTEVYETVWVDLNRDTFVDNEAFALLSSKWLQTGCDFCNGADLTGDGDVNFDDLLIVANNWLGDYADNSLMGYWEMNGDASDSSLYANHGNVHGSPVWEPSQHIGGSIIFDGVDDRIDIEGYKGVTGRRSRTVSAWIKTSSVSGVIVSWGDNSYSGSKWIVRVSNTGTLRAEVKGGYISGTTDLTADGQWHHIAAVLNSDGSPDISDVKLYVDGQPESVAGVTGAPIDTAIGEDVSIGTFQAGSAPFFNGLIDDVRVYRRALSEVEIQELADAN